MLLVCTSTALALTPSKAALVPGNVRGPSLSFAAAPTAQQRRTVPVHATALTAAQQPEPSGAPVVGSIANLAKNIVGSGVLALAAGIAAFADSKLALLPSIAILLFTGALSAYTYSLIARVGSAVGSSTYRETWTKVFSEKTAFIPDLTVIFMT